MSNQTVNIASHRDAPKHGREYTDSNIDQLIETISDKHPDETIFIWLDGKTYHGRIEVFNCP
jgi:hypothetical protein